MGGGGSAEAGAIKKGREGNLRKNSATGVQGELRLLPRFIVKETQTQQDAEGRGGGVWRVTYWGGVAVAETPTETYRGTTDLWKYLGINCEAGYWEFKKEVGIAIFEDSETLGAGEDTQKGTGGLLV